MDNLNSKISKYFDKYYVSTSETTSQEYFAGVITIALNEYKLLASEIANKFEVADSTVERWASRAAVPHPIIREMILDYINEKIK